MRCLTLADELRKHNATVEFVSQRLAGEMSPTIIERGYYCHLVEPTIRHTDLESPADAADLHNDAQTTLAVMSDSDWLIVDHYQLHDSWYTTLKPRSRRVLAIDDLANRTHHCDLLHDQTLGRQAVDYQSRTAPSCQKLVGIDYALLRPEFAQQRQNHAQTLTRTGQINHLLIALGGADPQNDALAILRLLEPLLERHRIIVMLMAGPQFQHVQAIRDWANESSVQVEIHHNTNEVAPLLLRADVAIGASGSSAWERCCLGLPTLACVVAENQAEIAERLQQAGASINWHSHTELQQQLSSLIEDPLAVASMSAAASRLCDGNGAKRVVNAMMAL